MHYPISKDFQCHPENNNYTVAEGDNAEQTNDANNNAAAPKFIGGDVGICCVTEICLQRDNNMITGKNKICSI